MGVHRAGAPANILGMVCLMTLALALVAGCAVVDERSEQQREAAYGPNPPRLEATYAAQVIAPGDVWYIFLNGSDPDGDLQYINVWMEIPARTTTPVRFKVDPDQKGFVSGYLTLHTLEFGGDTSALTSAWVRLRVHLEDLGGHRSQDADFFLQFGFGASAPPPPPGVFQDRLLGKIPVEFAPVEPATPGGIMRW